MKKLTDYQIENLIETVIQTSKDKKINDLNIYYTDKWNNTKTKIERLEFFNEFFKNRKTLLNEGYSNDEINEGLLGDLFSKGLGGFKSTFKEWISDKIISGLTSMFGIKIDPELLNAFKIGIANLNWSQDWAKLLSPVKNCNYFANVILDSVIEYYINKKIIKMFGDTVLSNSIRNALSDALTDEKYIQTIQNALSGVLCTALQKLFGSGSIKNAVSSMMNGSQIPVTP